MIDESHNFRNSDGQRYRQLLDEVIRQGARTKVLMLSETPVNTSPIRTCTRPSAPAGNPPHHPALPAGWQCVKGVGTILLGQNRHINPHWNESLVYVGEGP